MSPRKSITRPMYLVLGILAGCTVLGLIPQTVYFAVAAALSILVCGILDHQNRRLRQRLRLWY